MNSSDIFAKAAKKKFRFSTPVGQVSTEDLFDLPLVASPGKASLDSIAIDLDSQLKNKTSVKSFVQEKTDDDDDLQAKFDVVITVLNYKKAAAESARKAMETRKQNQKILELIEHKENGALAEKSIEELKAMLGNVT